MQTKQWLRYMLLIAALVVVSLPVTHDFFFVCMMMAMIAGRPIYQNLRKVDRMMLLFPYGLLLATGLAVIWYMGEVLVFSHSPRAAHRVHDAVGCGIFAAFAGFFIAWGENYRGLSMLDVPPPKTQEKR